MLKLLTKFFLSGGAVLGSFAATGNLPIQKKNSATLIPEATKGTVSSGEIKTIQDIAIFERNNNCSFSFSQTWAEQKVYSIEKFLETNKANEATKKYTEKAIKKANQFKDDCKRNGVIVLFYYGEDFNLTGTVSSG